MEEQEIDRILSDLMAGSEISAADRQLLKAWEERSEQDKHFAGEIREVKQLGRELKVRQDRKQVFDRIERNVTIAKRRRLIRRWSAAAAIVAVVISSALFYINLQNRNETQPVELVSTITPGRHRAELILSHGEIIQLDSLTRGKVINDDLTKIAVEEDMLIYTNENKQIRVEYHTVRVPLGGEYNLQLADGTKVYLNSGSSLRYPVHFSGDQREVQLTGEGYFEVARDVTKRFVIKAGDIDVCVLGTSFNVNAYPEENRIATTLVEGKVEIDYDGQKETLNPGMQLVFDKKDHSMKTSRVDTEIYTSWKDGYYYFKRETLGNIMNTLARWYDVKVFFQQSDLKELEFGGRLKRYEDIDYLLKKMEETQDVKFIIKGKTITIQRKIE